MRSYIIVNFLFDCSGFGCDTAKVIEILAHRDLTQRGLIQQEYRMMHSQELSKRLSSELSGDIKVQYDFIFITLSPQMYDSKFMTIIFF